MHRSGSMSWRMAWLTVAAAMASVGCGGATAEGRSWVRRINLKGTSQVDAKELKDRIVLAQTSWVPFAPKRYLDAGLLDADARRIEAYYHVHGYFSARVVQTLVSPPHKNGSVDVAFSVEEGQPSRIRRLQVNGLQALPLELQEKVRREMQLHEGEIFVHDRYLESKRQMEARLATAGYAWARVDGEAEVNRSQHLVDVALAVLPGVPVRFDSVEVRGDPSIDERAVTRRAGISMGTRFDPERLEQARARLYQLGLFSTVRVEVVPLGSDPARAKVVITVTPGKKNELRVGGGIGLEPQRQEVHVTLQYQRHSFLGGLRTLRLRLTPAWVWVPDVFDPSRSGPALNFDITFTQPDFLARDLAARVSIGYDLGVDYAFQYHGPRFSLGLGWNVWRNRVNFGLSYNFQYLMFFNTDPAILDEPQLARSFFGYTSPYRLGYIAEDISLDLRNSALDPHSGVLILLSFEEGAGILGGGFTYQRLVPDGRFYIPLGGRLTLALRMTYGRILTIGGDGDTPITRRLYAGGPDSHRGFGYNRLSPQVPSGSSVPPIPIGGRELLLSQIELRLGLFRLFGNWLGLVAFWDAGDVPESGRGLSFAELHHAVGGGLRYRTPIGTLRADLGVRLNRLGPSQPDGRQNPDPGSRFAFHISLGEAF